jgi:serine/threonine protein kinase
LIGHVGKYRVTEKLGRGGVGEVWKATDLSLNREVALKILRPELAGRPAVVASFRAEALALARLNHPNVATIYGIDAMDGQPFIVMEYVHGQTLQTIVSGFGPMRSERAIPYFLQVLDAIEHAHDHGLVHRDLKAANVMLTHQGIVKVLDFGISLVAKSVRGARGAEGAQNMGTPAWMAPEQVWGEEADVRTDVYALGLLLYWLTTGRLPFEGESPAALLRAHASELPPPPRRFASTLPEAVEKPILRALAKDRTERFATVSDFRAALAERFVPNLTVPLPSGTIQGIVESALPDELEREPKRPLRTRPAVREEAPISAIRALTPPANVHADASSGLGTLSGTRRRIAIGLLIAGSVAATLYATLHRDTSAPTAGARVDEPRPSLPLPDLPRSDLREDEPATAHEPAGESRPLRRPSENEKWVIRRH